MRDSVETPGPANNVIIQFESSEGCITGPVLDVPHDVTPSQLQALLNGLVKEDGSCTYTFSVQGQELGCNLGAHLVKHKVSVEAVLRVVYQPQAAFRVRAVTRCTGSMSGHEESILSVQFSPNGRSLASGSGDTSVRLWDLHTQTPKRLLKGHNSWVLVVAWSPDAALIGSGDHDGGICLWEPESGRALGQCKGHRKFITSLAWEPAHVQVPCRRLCSGSKDATLKVWDVNSRRCLYTMSQHTQAVTQVKWGGSGHIFSASRDCSINVWSAANGTLIHSLKGHGHWVNTMSLSTDYALRTGPYDHTGALPLNTADIRQTAQERYDRVLNGRPERLATGSDDFTILLWEPTTHKVPQARMAGHVQLVNQVTFSPDGRWIASASFDKSVKLWDGHTGTFLATFRGHVGPVYQVAWAADGRLLVSASKDSTLKVWDTVSKEPMGDLPGHADEVFSVDWSPDGMSVASGGKDRVLKLWRN